MAHVIRSFYPEAKLPDDEAGLGGLYRSILNGKRTLLLMDNAANAEQVAPVIPPSDSILLVTSRQHFQLPGMYAINLDVLTQEDSRRLLLGIEKRIGNHAEEIAFLCGHLPLALRLAASTLADRPNISPTEYIVRLQKTEGKTELVEPSLKLSYDLLNEEMQKQWCMLAVFPGSFDNAAAGAVWDVSLEKAQDILSTLINRSLVGENELANRYYLHNLIREFAISRLSDEECYAAQLRYAQHYVNVLTNINELYLKGGEGVTLGLKLFDLEWDNIRAGQAWATANATNDKQVAELCRDYPVAGMDVLDLRQHPREWIIWLDAALDACRRITDHQAAGEVLSNLGLSYAGFGESRRAIEYHEQALMVYREIGEPRGEVAALGNLGNAYARLGDTRRAIDFYERALLISREINERRGAGIVLVNLGNAYAGLGEQRRAIEYYEESLLIDREIGDRRGESQNLGNLGLAFAGLGEQHRALEYYEQQLGITREIGDRRGEGAALGNLGNAYAALGEPRRAIAYYEQALVITREIGDRRGEGNSLGNLGNVYAALDNLQRAIEYYEQHLVIAREMDDRRGEGNAFYSMSLALDELGQRAEAIANAEAALVIFEQIEDPSAAKVRRKLEEWKKES